MFCKTLLMKFILLILLSSVAATAPAQQFKRIKPGTLYGGGDVVRSPRYGMQTRIPQGWRGVLPQNTEVFIMVVPNDADKGQVFVLVNENDTPATVRTKFEQGINLAENLKLAPAGDVTERGEAIAAEFKLEGKKKNKGDRYYAESRCHPKGTGCLVVLLTGSAVSFEAGKAAVMEIMDQTKFMEPSSESPYTDFDWKKFLDNKVMVNFAFTHDKKKENTMTLCADGTFHSKFKSSELMNGNAKAYMGKKAGTWSVTGKGESTTLVLSFRGLEALNVTLSMRDEKVFANDQRYFVGENDNCTSK